MGEWLIVNLNQDAIKSKFLRIRDIVYNVGPILSVYPGVVESQTSDTTLQVTVTNTIRRVVSVWLASDTGFIGINYYDDPKDDSDYLTSDSSIITLDTALPNATEAVKVAYFSDCADCGFDPMTKSAIDSACTTCSGTGMTLADGTAISVSVKRQLAGVRREGVESLGEEPEGTVILHAKSEHENLIRAAIRMDFDDKQLRIQEDMNGDMRIRRKYNAAGQKTAIRIVTEHKDVN